MFLPEEVATPSLETPPIIAAEEEEEEPLEGPVTASGGESVDGPAWTS